MEKDEAFVSEQQEMTMRSAGILCRIYSKFGDEIMEELLDVMR